MSKLVEISSIRGGSPIRRLEDLDGLTCTGARGGWGTLHRATGPGGMPLAVKVIDLWSGALSASQRETAQESQTKEFEILEKLSGCEHVPAVHCMGTYMSDEGETFPAVVEDFIEGQTLSTVIARGRLSAERSAGSRGDARAVALVALDIALALREVHAKEASHRDLNPNNIIVRAPSFEEDGLSENPETALIDFGQSTDTTRDTITPSNEARLATYCYGAPETFGGDHRGLRNKASVDIWSFGALLTSMMLGNEYDTKELKRIRGGITGSGTAELVAYKAQGIDLFEVLKEAGRMPKVASLPELELRSIVAKCTKYNPKDRPTASELVDELGKVLDLCSRTQTPAATTPSKYFRDGPSVETDPGTPYPSSAKGASASRPCKQESLPQQGISTAAQKDVETITVDLNNMDQAEKDMYVWFIENAGGVGKAEARARAEKPVNFAKWMNSGITLAEYLNARDCGSISRDVSYVAWATERLNRTEDVDFANSCARLNVGTSAYLCPSGPIYRITRVTQETNEGKVCIFEGTYDDFGNLLTADYKAPPGFLQFGAYDDLGHYGSIVRDFGIVKDYEWNSGDRVGVDGIHVKGDYLFNDYHDLKGKSEAIVFYDNGCLRCRVTYDHGPKNGGVSIVRRYDRSGRLTHYSWPGVFEKRARWTIDANGVPSGLTAEDIDMPNILDKRIQAKFECDAFGNIEKAVFVRFQPGSSKSETETYCFQYIAIDNPSPFAAACAKLSIFDPALEALDLL